VSLGVRLMELTLWFVLILLPLEAAAALVLLIRTAGKWRRRFAWALLTLLVPGLLLLADRYALPAVGVALRGWVAGCLLVLMIAGAVTILVCVARYLRICTAWRWRLLCEPVALLGCLFTLWGSFFLFAFSVRPERVVEHDGQRFVEVNNSFLDQMYDYYDYRGPILRGSERRKNWANGTWWGEPWEDVRP